MAVLVEQDVLGLQVAVDDVPGVQVLDGEQDLAGIEFGHLLWKLLAATQQVEKLALRGGSSTPDMRSHSR